MQPGRGQLADDELLSAALLREHEQDFGRQLRELGSCVLRSVRAGLWTLETAGLDVRERVSSLFVAAALVSTAEGELSEIRAQIEGWRADESEGPEPESEEDRGRTGGLSGGERPSESERTPGTPEVFYIGDADEELVEEEGGDAPLPSQDQPSEGDQYRVLQRSAPPLPVPGPRPPSTARPSSWAGRWSDLSSIPEFFPPQPQQPFPYARPRPGPVTVSCGVCAGSGWTQDVEGWYWPCRQCHPGKCGQRSSSGPATNSGGSISSVRRAREQGLPEPSVSGSWPGWSGNGR